MSTAEEILRAICDEVEFIGARNDGALNGVVRVAFAGAADLSADQYAWLDKLLKEISGHPDAGWVWT